MAIDNVTPLQAAGLVGASLGREEQRRTANKKLKAAHNARTYGGLAEAAGVALGTYAQERSEPETLKKQRYLEASPEDQTKQDIKDAGDQGLGLPKGQIQAPGIGTFFGDVFDYMKGFSFKFGSEE